MCGRSPELFLGSKKKKKAWETLGRIVSKAFGDGAAAEKGGKVKSLMFTEEKKVSGKSDGEVKPIRGMVLRESPGRGRSPSQTSGRAHSGLSPCDPASRAVAPAQPSEGRLLVRPLTVCVRESH